MTIGSNAPAVKVLVLSETSEADASSQIRAIYEEIRELCGVPMVALIFRHLAAHPSVLEEVWEAIGPLFRNGQIQETAWQVARSTVPSGLLPPVGANARVVLGLIGEDLVKVRNALEAYNRANPVNQLAMLSLIARLGNDTPAIALPARRDWKPPTAIPGPLPQMISPDAMAPSVRLLINDFGFGDRSKLDPVVPSLSGIWRGGQAISRHFTSRFYPTSRMAASQMRRTVFSRRWHARPRRSVHICLRSRVLPRYPER